MLQRIKKLLEDNAVYIAIIVTISIAVLSLTAVPKINFGFKIESSDKYLHVLAYFVLTCIWLFSFREKIKKTRVKLFLISGIIIYGTILEVLQGGLTDYRTADLLDIVANSIGVLIATLLIHKLINWYNTI